MVDLFRRLQEGVGRMLAPLDAPAEAPAPRHGPLPARGYAARGEPDAGRHCPASGWQLRIGCTDGNGGAICPLCSQHVRTRPDEDASRPFRILQQHGRPAMLAAPRWSAVP
jgi:hypothetical protein